MQHAHTHIFQMRNIFIVGADFLCIFDSSRISNIMYAYNQFCDIYILLLNLITLREITQFSVMSRYTRAFARVFQLNLFQLWRNFALLVRFANVHIRASRGSR